MLVQTITEMNCHYQPDEPTSWSLSSNVTERLSSAMKHIAAMKERMEMLTATGFYTQYKITLSWFNGPQHELVNKIAIEMTDSKGRRHTDIMWVKPQV